ncbi:zinc finger and BTB domain-containing protein 8A [Chironomus tepperi]|uniref:zinc finger and BTB domain-containing protein 8A n=1 Tax=Chironomus tepperi TaxID=113505 RepID=UPI00391F44FE
MFTNWLTSDISSKSRTETNSSTPDCIIEVGPPPFARFPAHSAILSTQSGYFRAAILRISENGKQSENSIFLPNISVEHFTPLLTYMYTGYLELNFENIFGVLLATHLLHMPRALEICREFLSQNQQRQQSDFFGQKNSKLVRPIASKPPSNYGLNFVSPPKVQSNFSLTSHGTNFKKLLNEREIQKPIRKLPDEEKVAKKILKVSPPSPVPHTSTIKNENSDSKVVIDIASCDGPVRFRRILNEAYEHNKHPNTSSTSISTDNEQSDLKYQSNVSSFHQQMVKNINEQYNKQKSVNSGEESENSQHSIEIYTCIYCNHTFKSKYCYQKHAKRHINPLNPLGRCRPDDCESSDGEAAKQQQICVKRDSIKPLDMNVQYYPCKICGCKFPSYYFVHKHRKMCHPEVEADGNGNLIQNASSSLSNSSSQNQQNDNQINVDECSNKEIIEDNS